MQKDYAGNGAVPQSPFPQIVHDSPPPPAYVENIIPFDNAKHAPVDPVGSRQTLAISPPTQTAPSSHDDLDSLVRKAERYGTQFTKMRNACMSFLRRYPQFGVLREDVLLQRSALIHLWEDQKNQRRFVDDSQRAFLEEAEAFITAFSADYPLEKLQNLHDHVCADHDRQIEKAEQINMLESNLSKQEYKLQQLEHRLAQTTSRISTALNEMAVGDHAGYVPSSPPTEASRDELPPLIQHYFDKAGDVLLERDKLFNLELSHRGARNDRAYQIDLGRPPSLAEEEFEAAYQREFDEAELGLNDAVRKAELARAVCLSEGLNPESYRKVPTDPGKANAPEDHDEVGDAPNTPSSHALDETNHAQIPSHEPVYEPLSIQQDSTSVYPPWPRARANETAALDERVRNWMQDLTLPEEPTTNRSRPVSEARHSGPGFELLEDGKYGLSKTSIKARRQQELDPYVRQLVDGDNGVGHPMFLKRSSSATEHFSTHPQHSTRQDAFDHLRSLSMPIPGYR